MLLDIVKKGSTDRSITLRIIDSADGTPETGVVFNTTGIDLWYRREGAAKTSITEATLSALTDAHSDGGFLHVGDGTYRLDSPDAAFASGVNYVDFGGTVTGMIVIGGRVRLADFDIETSTVLVGDKTGFSLSSAGVQAIWDALTAVMLASGSIGKRLADNIDAATSSRSSHSAADVWASGTRTLSSFGTLVADIWAALTSGLSTSGSIGKYILDNWTTLLARVTSARAGYLDNLNVGGNVASSTEVVSIQNNTRVVRVVPPVIERPDSGSTTYRIELLLYDAVGNMEAPDSAPTIALVNQAGTDRSSRLDSATMALVSTGRYRAILTADVGDTLEQLVWAFSVVEGGVTRLYGNQSVIVDTTAVDFTASDRTKLEALASDNADGGRTDLLIDSIIAKTSNLPASPAAVGSQMDLVNTPNATAITAIQGGLASAANLATVAGYLDTEITAILVKVNALPSDPADASDIAALAASLTTLINNAQATLDKLKAVDYGSSEVTGPRTLEFEDGTIHEYALDGSRTTTEP